MAEGRKSGSIIVELSLDATKYTSAQKEILAAAEKNSADIEQTFGRVGITSDKMYDAMRKSVQNSLAAIKQSHLTTADEKIRAEQSAANKINQINEQQYGKHVSMIDTMKKNWLGLVATATAAYYAISRVTGAYIEEEAAVLRLGVAMKNQGDYTREGLQAFKDHASAIQRTTAVADDAVLAVMGNLKSYGMLDSEVRKATQTVLDFAEGAKIEGMTVETAGQLIGKAYAGNTATLSRYGIVIDSTLTGAAKFDAVLKQLNERFGGSAQAQLASYGGQWTNLKNQLGDLADFVGLVVLKSIQALSAAGAGLAFPFLWSIEKMLRGLTWLTDKVSYVAGKLGFEGLEKSIGSITDRMRSGADEAKRLADEASKFAKDNLKAAVSGDAIGEMLDKMKSGARTGKAGGVDPAAAAAAKKLEDEILKGEISVARAIDKLKADMLKKEMDALKFMRDEENRLFQEREKGMVDYKKIVTEANDWSVSEHQRAINKILSSEETQVARIYELWEAGTISLAQLDEGLAAVRGATGIATEALIMRQLSEELSIYEDLSGFEDTYYKKKLEYLDLEIEKLREKFQLTKDVTDAMRQQGQNAIADAATERRMDDIIKKTSGYADMLEGIGGLYDRNSKQAKLAHDAASAASIIQQALLLKEAIAAAVVAVATQGKGDPYTAFARVAAMIATMAGVLSQAGVSFGGGGGGGASAPVLPASTVLGAEAGTGSESISKVWELLEDTYDLEYRELTGIHNSVKDLNRNITGLVTSIVRTGGVEGFSVGGSSTGFELGKDTVKGAFDFMTLGIIDRIAGGYVGDFIDKAWGFAFGSKKQRLMESGIAFGGATAGELASGGSMDAQEYALIQTKKRKPLGKTKTRYDYAYAELDEDISRLIDIVYQDLSATLVEVAKGLGADVNAVLAYEFKAANVNLMGMTGDEINKTLSEYFSKVGDEAVTALFGDLVAQYQQLNEGLFETAARLVIDKAIVTEILKMTNQGLPGTTAQIIAFSESLIEMAGGLEELQDAASVYYDKFFTEEEKTSRTFDILTGHFADMNSAFPDTRAGFRAMLEGLDLTTDAGKEQYVTMLQLAGAADEYYDAMGDVLDQQDDLTDSLRDQAAMIRDWINDMNRSALAPVTSMEAFQSEYERQKALAYAPGATTQDVSGFLNYAKEYLQFMRTYGGDYQAIYDAVMGDAGNLADMKDAEALQLDAIREADVAAREAARTAQAQLAEIARLIAGIPPGQVARPMGIGGLTSGISVAGEKGQEWIVPTYEPQRSRFLESAPPQFWENLRGAGVVQSGGGGDITVRVPVYLDGKVVADVVAKHIPRSANLTEAIRRVN